MQKQYAVVEIHVDILNIYGLYRNERAAQEKADIMAKQAGYANQWGVMVYNGYGKWKHTGYRALKALKEPEDG